MGGGGSCTSGLVGTTAPTDFDLDPDRAPPWTSTWTRPRPARRAFPPPFRSQIVPIELLLAPTSSHKLLLVHHTIPVPVHPLYIRLTLGSPLLLSPPALECPLLLPPLTLRMLRMRPAFSVGGVVNASLRERWHAAIR